MAETGSSKSGWIWSQHLCCFHSQCCLSQCLVEYLRGGVCDVQTVFLPLSWNFLSFTLKISTSFLVYPHSFILPIMVIYFSESASDSQLQLTHEGHANLFEAASQDLSLLWCMLLSQSVSYIAVSIFSTSEASLVLCDPSWREFVRLLLILCIESCRLEDLDLFQLPYLRRTAPGGSPTFFVSSAWRPTCILPYRIHFSDIPSNT